MDEEKRQLSASLPVWQPSLDFNSMTEYSRTLPKIKHLKKGITHNGITDRLKETWLGKTYTNHLKQHAFIRLLVQWIWRNGYVNCLSKFFHFRKEEQWRTITKLSKFTDRKGIKTYKLANAEYVETPKIKAFPASDQDYLASPHDRYIFPEIFVAVVKNATTYGGTNLILTNNEVICHDLYDFKHDFTSEELLGRTLISPKRQRIRWLLHDKMPEHIPAAASFVDACASNYAHWLTEILPRAAMFCSNKHFKDIPIVVNDGLHKNIMESLLLVTGVEREIITLPIGRALHVDNLYITSASGYLPFERRNTKIPGHSHGLFSPQAFQLIRNNTNKGSKLIDKIIGKIDWPEKIFLRRNSEIRNITNAVKLENLLIDRGFTIIEPEKFLFLQQQQLFRHAKIIIGATGASFANMIFASQNTKIFILISKHPDLCYWYWQNIACASGKTINYILGEIEEKSFRLTGGIHSNYTIDLNMLLQELDEQL